MRGSRKTNSATFLPLAIEELWYSLSMWLIPLQQSAADVQNKVTVEANSRSLPSCTLWACARRYEDFSSDRKQRNGTLLVGVLYSVDTITRFDFFVCFCSFSKGCFQADGREPRKAGRFSSQ